MAQSAILNLLFLVAEQPEGLLVCEVYDSKTWGMEGGARFRHADSIANMGTCRATGYQIHTIDVSIDSKWRTPNHA